MNTHTDLLKSISRRDFLSLGKNQVCYLRPIYQQGAIMYGLFDADGEQVSIFPDVQTAEHAVFQNDIRTVHVH